MFFPTIFTAIILALNVLSIAAAPVQAGHSDYTIIFYCEPGNFNVPCSYQDVQLNMCSTAQSFLLPEYIVSATPTN